MSDFVTSGVVQGSGTSNCLRYLSSVLQKITHGTLRVVTSDHTYDFDSPRELGDPSTPNAELRVVSDTFWIRLCLMNDLGFSEAYMYGEVECDDLIPLFLVGFRNPFSEYDTVLRRFPLKLRYSFVTRGTSKGSTRGFPGCSACRRD